MDKVQNERTLQQSAVSTARQRAQAYFEEGYNCSQSVFLAFADRYGFSKELAARMSASFGGGVGRLREICGTVSGMALVCGLECGATEGADQEGKAANYEQMQTLAAQFQEQNGSLICRTLLGLDGQTDGQTDGQRQDNAVGSGVSDITGGMGHHQPQARTAAYYATRPCKELVGSAAEILEHWLESHEEAEC